MALSWEQVIIDAHDPVALGRWWASALGWAIVNEAPGEMEIQEHPGQTPGLLFVQVSETKSTKNRLHLDFRPQDQAAEVDRFLTLGASRADVGQGEVPWVVLTDPEGNEFCVLSSRPPAA
jgi:predicted enzyme related to lactoylglutathione lyase